MNPTPAHRAEIARLLRQRVEMGGGDLFLDELSRDDALRLAGKLRKAARAAAASDARGGHAGASNAPSRAGSPRASGPDRVEPSAVTDPEASPSGEAGSSLPALPEAYDAVRELALGCTRCRLAETRTRVVFSDGAVDARLVVVGEAPGANEDATGLPFVGAAGQFLDLLLATVDLSREETVYICNVLKCRPPGNRNPLPDEIEACAPFLTKQLELIAPQALLAVGTFAAQSLTGLQRPLGKLRGEVHAYQGIPLVVTYHPAALLRNAGWTRAFWDDLQLLRRILDGG